MRRESAADSAKEMRSSDPGGNVTLQFDKATAQLLDDAYRGRDFVRRRFANLESLAPRQGDRVVDIGCGTGLLTEDLARIVGESGEVVGVDPSADMRESAQARCQRLENVRIVDGSSDCLPLDANEADRAVCVQVFEYLNDIPATLAECRRILRPGGVLVIGDHHFDSLVWHSADPARMRRMIDSWDMHFVERRVPAILPGLLIDTGFECESVRPVQFLDTTLRRDGLARMMMILMSAYARNTGQVDLDEVDAWVAEQEALAATGRFFFSFCHYVVRARKPV